MPGMVWGKARRTFFRSFISTWMVTLRGCRASCSNENTPKPISGAIDLTETSANLDSSPSSPPPNCDIKEALAIDKQTSSQLDWNMQVGSTDSRTKRQASLAASNAWASIFGCKQWQTNDICTICTTVTDTEGPRANYTAMMPTPLPMPPKNGDGVPENFLAPQRTSNGNRQQQSLRLRYNTT